MASATKLPSIPLFMSLYVLLCQTLVTESSTSLSKQSTNTRSLVSQYITLSRNNKIDTITEYPEEFVLSFNLHPLSTVNQWTNILRITSSPYNDCCEYTDRWIGIWCSPNSYMLSFAAGNLANGNPSKQIHGVEGNKDNFIEIRAIGEEIKFYVNGKHNATLWNANRPSVDQLEVYASDDFFSPLNAYITQYEFTNIGLSSSPSSISTTSPTPIPTVMPTISPTSMPTNMPTDSSTSTPTASQTSFPTNMPTASSTSTPTNMPTASSTSTPTTSPTSTTIIATNIIPTTSPTSLPSITTNIPTIVVMHNWSENETSTNTTDMMDDWPQSEKPNPSLLEICIDVVQRGFIVDNLSWESPNHTSVSDNIDRSKKPYLLTKEMLVDSSTKGFGLVAKNHCANCDNLEFVYSYNFSKIGTEITLQYLLNENRNRGFEIYAVGIHCYHNNTFLLGNIEGYEPESEPESHALPVNEASTIMPRLGINIFISSSMVVTTICCITVTFSMLA